MQEVKLLSERQEVLKGMVEDKNRLPSRTTQKDYDQNVEEMELDEKKSREDPLIGQKNHDLWSDENERYYARRLQRSGSSRRTRKDADTQNLSFFEACMSSAVDHVEEVSLESPRKVQDVQEVMSESARCATRGRGEDAWRLEPEGETESWWIHSNVANFDSVPTRHQLDFKKALSTMYRLKQAEDEMQYAKWSQSSSSSWQWQKNWWESDYEYSPQRWYDH